MQCLVRFCILLDIRASWKWGFIPRFSHSGPCSSGCLCPEGAQPGSGTLGVFVSPCTTANSWLAPQQGVANCRLLAFPRSSLTRAQDMQTPK